MCVFYIICIIFFLCAGFLKHKNSWSSFFLIHLYSQSLIVDVRRTFLAKNSLAYQSKALGRKKFVWFTCVIYDATSFLHSLLISYGKFQNMLVHYVH